MSTNDYNTHSHLQINFHVSLLCDFEQMHFYMSLAWQMTYVAIFCKFIALDESRIFTMNDDTKVKTVLNNNVIC